jgi:DNA/RNA-binding domain of Phe-tRNA-synthetase-like protein
LEQIRLQGARADDGRNDIWKNRGVGRAYREAFKRYGIDLEKVSIAA